MQIDNSNNTTKNDEIKTTDFVREVTAKYIGPRRKSASITLPADAAKYVRSLLRDGAREHFIAVYLNGASQIVSHSIVSIGTATSAPAGPREIFVGAILVGAVSLLLAHNHPSGETRPSNEDRLVTRTLCEAGKLLGIKVLDHIIVSEESYYSFQEMGEIPS